MANALPAVLGVAGFIQQSNAQNDANKRANKQLKGQEAITQQQLDFFKNLILPTAQAGMGAIPGLAQGIGGTGQRALDLAQSYNPQNEYNAFKGEYNASLGRDISNARVPVGLRGLGGSSEDSAQTGGVLTRRALDLANFRASLPQRQMQMLGQGVGVGAPAFQSLNPAAISQGSAGTLPGAAQTMGNMAQQNFGQAAAIDPFKSLQGINWDFMKMK